MRRATFGFPPPSRRAFMAAGAAAALGASRSRAAADGLRVGVIGCGGRGNGAIQNVMEADASAVVVALGDAFEDQAGKTLELWTKHAKYADRIKATPATTFSGFDAYQKVIEAGVDLVLLTEPSGFRPLHLEAAIAAGKHVFAEKSVAVDSAGVRRVLAAADAADKKGLSVVVGYNLRYDTATQEWVKRIRGGALGDITAAECIWKSTGIFHRARQSGWSRMEYQVRNWYHYNWGSSGQINDQLSHKLDVANWALGGHPLRAVGRGTRGNGTLPADGDIFDDTAVTYTYPKNVVVTAVCCLDKTVRSEVDTRFTGTEGHAQERGWKVTRGENTTAVPAAVESPYTVEQAVLLKAIRDGRPVNDLRRGADTALTAIMGRMACQSGKEVTWEQALASPEDLTPPELRRGKAVAAIPAVPPGGGKYALLAGVKDYDHQKLLPLSFTENDVTVLAAELRKAGFQVTLLTGAAGRRDADLKPTGANIRARLAEIVKKTTRTDTVFVGFAGHGVQFEGDKAGAYFCPVDARPFPEDAATLVSLADVYKDLNRSGAGVKLLVVDACRDDPAGGRGIDSDTAPRPPKGVAALFSCSAGQRAFEDGKYEHGIFFYHLLEGLKGGAANARGDVTWDGLQGYVRDKVTDDPTLVRKGARQEPNLIGDLSGKSPVLRTGTK